MGFLCGAGAFGDFIAADDVRGIFETIIEFGVRTKPACHHTSRDDIDRRSSGPGAARSLAHEHWPGSLRLRRYDKGIPETIVEARINPQKVVRSCLSGSRVFQCVPFFRSSALLSSL